MFLYMFEDIEQRGKVMIKVDGNIITVTTKSQTAVFSSGVLVSLSDKTGRKYIENDGSGEALYIVYRSNEQIPLKNTGHGTVTARKISETEAEYFLEAWDGDGVIDISEDRETGDIVIEPEVTSARSGIIAARLPFTGIDDNLNLIAPFYQGINMRPDDELLTGRKWTWPKDWEAGFAIMCDNESGDGFWVHTRDSSYRPKSMMTGQGTSKADIAFDSEAFGPIDENRSAGGLAWRINVFKGGWRVPAGIYRDWLWKAYDLEKEESRRREWTKDISFAVSWCPSSIDYIDELTKHVDPRKTLLHLPGWRKFGYDQNYPDYTPSDSFKEFIAYAENKGFRCMPHANSIDMDPSMPEYRFLQDFKYRELESGRFLGWGYEEGKILGVPSSNKALDVNRERNVMVKIHPGLAIWRSILTKRIDEALDQLNRITDAIFIDVTLCSWNLMNALVDNTTSMEGMKKLISQVEGIGDGLVVGGEGLNEITMQNLSFAQAHLFDSHHATRNGLERCGGIDLNNYVFGRLCRTIGYSNLNGQTENAVLRERIHEEHGAIPTITDVSIENLRSPNKELKRVFDLANS